MEIGMLIRAAPFKHQQEAFSFACNLFGLTEGGDAKYSIKNTEKSAALLMEM